MTPLAHPLKLLLFVLLSLADLALTGLLLGHSEGDVYEANPLARWCLVWYGPTGLVLFKAGVVSLVLGLAVVISRFQPRAAGRVLGFGCATLAAVVLYSATLCQAALVTPEERLAQMDRESAEINRQTAPERQQASAFRTLLARQGQLLSAGGCTLREAVEQLAATERGSDPRWLENLARNHPGRPPQEVLAACVCLHTIVHTRHTEGREVFCRLVRRLEREFQDTYGSPAPREFRWFLHDGTANRRPGRLPATLPTGGDAL
jgi:hypothetical protein